MPTLNASLPAHFYAHVRREYLRNLEDGHGEYEEAAVFGVRSVPNRALGFHVHLKSGGVFWNLPVSALCARPHPEHLPLWTLEAWDAFGYELAVTRFEYLRERGCQVRTGSTKAMGWRGGTYAGVTIDWHSDGYSDTPDQQKCAHLIALNCGCYTLQPNNRVLWCDGSFVEMSDEPPAYRANTYVFSSEG